MAKVTGIGGVFLRSSDPAELAAWYREILGIEIDDNAMAIMPSEDDTYSVFSLFPSDSTYLGDPATQHAMVNFRVDDLRTLRDEMIGKGAAVEDITEDPYGLFTWTHDPDGRRIELWQPLDGE